MAELPVIRSRATLDPVSPPVNMALCVGRRDPLRIEYSSPGWQVVGRLSNIATSSGEATVRNFFRRAIDRTRDWSLRMLLHFAQSGWLETLLRPFGVLAAYWFMWAVLFGHLPKRMVEADSDFAKKMAELREQRVQAISTDRDRAYGRTVTWGLAGVGVVILTAIVANNLAKPAASATSSSLWLAAASFAFAVPLLIMLGLIYLSQAEPKSPRPTARQALSIAASIWVAQLIFILGFTAFLWSFSPIISLIFLLSCYRAWRAFRKYTESLPSPTPTVPSSATPPGQPTATTQPADADPGISH
jgi:hypothetical protein